MKPVLLFCKVGNETLPTPLARRFRVLSICLSGKWRSGDFFTDCQKLRTALAGGWSGRSFDLLNVMCGVRAADRFFVSEGVFRARRRIPLAVGVTDKQHWQEVRESFQAAAAKLSEDTLDFHPIQLPDVPDSAMPLTSAPPSFSSAAPKPDCVCLFSGGLDSFAGVAYLLARNRRPVLVSQSVGPVSGLQKRLFQVLRERFPRLSDEWIVQASACPNTARIERECSGRSLHWRHRDQLQRLRSMYFLSLAALVARAVGVNEIFMCENGLVGAAVVFSPRDDTPFTTRPAEPHYLRAVERFLQLALGWPALCIRNPFQYMTKGQVIKEVQKLGLRDSLYQTVSCWRSGNCGIRNCGQCVPCLFRQLAFDEAGLSVPPPKHGYRHPIPKKHWRAWRSTEVEFLEDTVEYCRKVAKSGRNWLLGNELAVVDAIDVTKGPVKSPGCQHLDDLDRQAPFKVARVIQRFAKATVRRLR